MAWVLFENRGHDGAYDKGSSEDVRIRRAEALGISLRSVSVRPPPISRLINPGQHANRDNRDPVARRFPGKLEFLLRGERSGIGNVGDIEIGDDPEDALFFLLFDLNWRHVSNPSDE